VVEFVGSNMAVCPECDAEVPDDAMVCHGCGANLNHVGSDDAGPAVTTADYDPEEAREQFERRYGIDIGDRTVEEFLAHLDRRDYSLTVWFWLVVVAELTGIVLFAATIFEVFTLGLDGRLVFTAISALLGLAIFADTSVVGQFERWAKIRWTYVLLSAVPLVGHIAGVLYLTLRHLMYEQTVEHRQRLMNAGFDVGPGFADD
jgi:hypothetical protein